MRCLLRPNRVSSGSLIIGGWEAYSGTMTFYGHCRFPNPTLDAYYQTLTTYAGLGVSSEEGIRTAFRSLLETYAKPVGWTLVEEYALPEAASGPMGPFYIRAASHAATGKPKTRKMT